MIDDYLKAFGPVFVAGFAIQQLLEILNPLIDFKFKTKKSKPTKKLIMGLLSLAIGLALAGFTELRVLKPFGIAISEGWDIIITGLVLSAGTEGANSIMKFLGYTKENQNPGTDGDTTEEQTVTT